MLKHLGNIGFIGDLSAQDADILAMYASKSQHVLEFGVGGSTQILSQCKTGLIISIDTDAGWIERTKHNLTLVEKQTNVSFGVYSELKHLIDDVFFDMVLVDGVDHLRCEFSSLAWQRLVVGGVMLFHDTRRLGDFKNVAWLMEQHFNEISSVDINATASNGKSSNITVIHKKSYEPYEDWNVVEGKPAWAFGGAPNVNNNPVWRQPK